MSDKNPKKKLKSGKPQPKPEAAVPANDPKKPKSPDGKKK